MSGQFSCVETLVLFYTDVREGRRAGLTVMNPCKAAHPAEFSPSHRHVRSQRWGVTNLTALQFGLYRDGDNNPDVVQSPVIDQAFRVSARDKLVAFTVEDTTSRRDSARRRRRAIELAVACGARKGGRLPTSRIGPEGPGDAADSVLEVSIEYSICG